MNPNISEKDIEKACDKINILRQDINDLGRIIKVWEVIANAIKKFNDLKHHSFFGFIQEKCSLPLISINSVKLSKESKKYINSVLGKIFSRNDYSNLIKNSKIQSSITGLEEITSDYNDYRNKRHAHLEDIELDKAQCNLLELFKILANLRTSVNYIESYILNFTHISNGGEWSMDVDNHQRNLHGFEQYFQDDPSINGCIQILECLNKSKIV